jgi:putative aminopeptidase FrvX
MHAYQYHTKGGVVLNFRKTIGALSQPPGVSGYENDVAESARVLLEPLCNRVETLPLYPVVGVRDSAKPGAPRVLLDAHIDQIGFIVTGYEDTEGPVGGFVRIAACGGFDPRTLPAKEVIVHAPCGRLHGIVACLPPHLKNPDAPPRAAIPLKDLSVDLGMPAARVRELVPLGTPVTVKAEPFGIGGDFIGGAALDDRACFAAILYALELLKDEPLPVELIAVGSTREEVDGRGAATAAHHTRPDYAVAVDVTHAGTPDAPKERTVPIGSGAAIGIGPHLNRRVSSTLVRIAQAQNIPHTREILPSFTGTNASVMQTVRAGIATGLVSLPLRYMHTGCEVIREHDAKACGELLAAFVRSFNEGVPRC